MAFSDPGKGRIIGQGEGLVKITLAEACKAGDILGYSSGWTRALATVGTAIQARLVAGEDGANGDVITAYRRGQWSVAIPAGHQAMPSTLPRGQITARLLRPSQPPLVTAIPSSAIWFRLR